MTGSFWPWASAAARLEESRRLSLEDTFCVPGGVQGITPLVQDSLVKIEEWIFKEDMARVALFYSKRLSGASYRPHTLALLPLDARWLDELASREWPSRRFPTFTLDPDRLFSELLRQYLFVALYCGAAESLASENASRFASMQGAQKNIEDLLEDLEKRFRQQSQMSITEALLDITAGFEALREEAEDLTNLP